MFFLAIHNQVTEKWFVKKNTHNLYQQKEKRGTCNLLLGYLKSRNSAKQYLPWSTIHCHEVETFSKTWKPNMIQTSLLFESLLDIRPLVHPRMGETKPLCMIARIVICFLPLTLNHNATGKSILAKRSFQHEWTPNYIRHFMPPNHTVHNLLPPKKSNNPHQQPLHIINFPMTDLAFLKNFPLSPSSNSQMKKNNIRPFNPKVAARPEVQREIRTETRRLGVFWDPLRRSIWRVDMPYMFQNTVHKCLQMFTRVRPTRFPVSETKSVSTVWKKQPHGSITRVYIDRI